MGIVTHPYANINVGLAKPLEWLMNDYAPNLWTYKHTHAMVSDILGYITVTS